MIKVRLLGIANIIAGMAFMLIVFLMQGFYLALSGILYIVFGAILLGRKFRNILLFFGIIPVTALFSLTIIMLGIAEDVPKHYHTPLGIGLIIILPFWLIVVANILVVLNAKSSLDK